MFVLKHRIIKKSDRCLRFILRTLSNNCLEEKIVKSPAPFYDELPKGNYVNTIFRNIDKWWMKPAIECSESGISFTFSEVVEQMQRWSGFLKSFGVTPNQCVTYISHNCVQFVPLFFGTISLGIPFSPLNSKYTPDELQQLITRNRSRFLIFTNKVEEKVIKMLKEDVEKFHLFCIGKPLKLKAQNVDDILYGKQRVSLLKPSEINGDETAYIPFSSGTTGSPKAVELTHNALSASMITYCNPYHDLPWKPEGLDQTVLLGMLPFFHIYGCFVISAYGLFTGAKTIILPSFSPDQFVDKIIQHKITLLHTVPSLLILLNNSSKCNSETFTNLDTVLCGAAPVLKSSVEEFRQKLKRNIDMLEGYGMTEHMITHLTPRRFKSLNGCGHLLSNTDGKIVCSDTGKSLGPNEIGEICIKTPSIMKGYLNNEKATNEMVKDGWVYTGDIGYYDEEEFFYIIDRTKDLIKVQGMQVSPSEIETELHKHPSVAECSVIGKPDEIYGEVPFAFIVPKKEVSPTELQNFLENKLSKHKQLRGGIKFVDNLPKSDTGKVLRRMLRSMI